jgi:hypothetical protein
VHDPVGLLPVGCPALVEDECLPHADEPAVVLHRLVPPRGFPEPSHGRPVRPRPRWVLAVFVAEEVPLVLLVVPDPAMLCTGTKFRSTHTRTGSRSRSISEPET